MASLALPHPGPPHLLAQQIHHAYRFDNCHRDVAQRNAATMRHLVEDIVP